MADRRQKESRDVHLDYAFDRLLAAKLQQVYEILVPDRVRIAGEPRKVTGEDHEERRDLREGLLRQAERGEHHCQSDGGAARVRPRSRLQRPRRVDLRRRGL